jgi:superfamily II DNA or RNA helicase
MVGRWNSTSGRVVYSPAARDDLLEAPDKIRVRIQDEAHQLSNHEDHQTRSILGQPRQLVRRVVNPDLGMAGLFGANEEDDIPLHDYLIIYEVLQDFDRDRYEAEFMIIRIRREDDLLRESPSILYQP